MNPGGDAAEQVVRMSLEGVEVAARITGTGAKNIAILLAAVLKEEQKTRGKARMTNMSEQMTVEMSEQIKRIAAFKEMLMKGEDKNE